jgi:hypothetical protein
LGLARIIGPLQTGFFHVLIHLIGRLFPGIVRWKMNLWTLRSLGTLRMTFPHEKHREEKYHDQKARA